MTGVQTCALPICFPVTILAWVDKVREALTVSEDEWVASGEEPYTEEDMLDMIHHWVDEELNQEIRICAEKLLESKNDGSYWDGEH